MAVKRTQAEINALRGEVMAAAKAGERMRETAARLKISTDCVRLIRKDAGFRAGATLPIDWSTRDADLAAGVAAKKKWRVIAADLGVSHMSARNRAVALGILQAGTADLEQPKSLPEFGSPACIAVASKPLTAPRHIPTGQPYRGIAASTGLGGMAGRRNHMTAARGVGS